jgi:hypothetical protein
MISLRVWLAFSALIACSSFASVALADNVADARVLYLKGNTAFVAEDDVLAREYYRQSLEKFESFDTVCNLGRSEARSKLFPESYEHLRLCLYLYPKDKELHEARAKFVELVTQVRAELDADAAGAIEARVAANIAAREKASAPAPSSGLGTTDAEPAVGEGAARKWKLPLVLSLAGAGVASGAVGAVFLVKAGALNGDADDLRSDLESDACAGTNPDAACEDIVTRVEKSDKAFNAGVVALAGAGTLLVGALVVQLLVPSRSHPQRTAQGRGIQVTPTGAYLPGTDSWAVGLYGKF